MRGDIVIFRAPAFPSFIYVNALSDWLAILSLIPMIVGPDQRKDDRAAKPS